MKINKTSIDRPGFQMIVNPSKPKLTHKNHNKSNPHNEPIRTQNRTT